MLNVVLRSYNVCVGGGGEGGERGKKGWWKLGHCSMWLWKRGTFIKDSILQYVGELVEDEVDVSLRQAL